MVTGTEQKFTTEQVTELLYRHDLAKLRDLISEYLERKATVWILFDNLDKGWSTQGVDEIDATVLRCLIDAGRKIEREMRKADRSLHCVVFVRNDVYEHVMKHSADYGKEMRAVLDWTEPDLLREMLRLRLVSALDGKAKNMDFVQIWPTFCVSHCHGEETSGYLIERSLMRPRNILKIFNHCRGFATNFRHVKIDEEDIEKGLRAYSNDLLVELDHELTDVFPAARDHFLDAAAVMSDGELSALIKSAAGDRDNKAPRSTAASGNRHREMSRYPRAPRWSMHSPQVPQVLQTLRGATAQGSSAFSAPSIACSTTEHIASN
jgi:hypothetical protein